ncbi:hypothetical protein IGI04_042414 [Brassica rapa subsp. trilocularis]|uniref:Uncharacterized protein n=1 Tax=Brassica rapa subsp. trilocularis TaxID=1813537 RepID=A0ABQ7KMS6_BRACM|nr:hypothetical protein IGI04_042414 [Brassica rapa subsp. trilocularis]
MSSSSLFAHFFGIWHINNHKLPVCLFPFSLINFDWLETASWEGKDSVLQMMKQVKQPQLVFNPPPAASHVQNPAEKPREFQREREKEEQKNQSVCYLEKDQKLQAYLGEEDHLRPSSPLVRLAKVWSFASPILSIQSLGKPQSSESDELLS